jgi:hypothetical protein
MGMVPFPFGGFPGEIGLVSVPTLKGCSFDPCLSKQNLQGDDGLLKSMLVRQLGILGL